MSEDTKPRRRCVLRLEIQADSPMELARALDEIGLDAMNGELPPGRTSGGVAVGYDLRYSDDPDWTHDRYFEAIQPLLAPQSPTNG